MVDGSILGAAGDAENSGRRVRDGPQQDGRPDRSDSDAEGGDKGNPYAAPRIPVSAQGAQNGGTTMDKKPRER